MGNHCCRPVPFLRGRGSAFVDAMSDRDLVDWRVVERDERGDGENGDGGDNGNNNGLTIILNLFETSKIARTTTWLRSNSHMIRHVLMGRPRRPNDPDHDDDDDAQQQPNWSSPAMQQLFVAIGDIPKLEVLLLNEVGSSENPMPIRFLSSVLHKRHVSLKQAYLSGHFQGDQDDCETFATRIAQQSQLQCFALYGNAQREFNLDPILQAASTLPVLKDLHFHANMPHPIANQTIVQVGRMAHLEKLTLHSCDIAGDNMATLGETLLQSATSLRELTVFEAFCPNFAQLHSHDDDNSNSHQHQHSSLIALTNLLRDSLSLRKVQIWFGFASNTAILVPFATQALAHNPRITHFNTALLWTPKYYDETAIQAYVDMLAHSNTTIQQLHIYKYTGIWRLALYFYLRLNQTGRRGFCNGCETSMTAGEWIDTVLTAIPPAKADVRDDTYYANNNLSFLEDEPDGWFEISWLYYYLRLQPSIMATAAATTET